MKAIILTYAPITEFEQQILKETAIFKAALNNHAEEFKPDIRIITDYILDKIYKKFPQKIISFRDTLKFQTDRIEYPTLKFKGATIIAAIDYLISKNYNEILLAGNNKVNNLNFQNIINTEIDKISSKIKLYQYSNGNFNLPVKTISEFCN